MKPKFVKFVLPPVAFSNAMNKIYPDWDAFRWPDSKEWKLFNAGRAAAMSDASAEAAGMFKEFCELSEQGGMSRGTS
jgi:hypothetical protein